jgi:hypothetical protein
MDYTIEETVTPNRYTATITFSERISDIFRNKLRHDNYIFTFIDTIELDDSGRLRTIVLSKKPDTSIEQIDIDEYGISTPYYSDDPDRQIQESLIKNGGLLVYLSGDYKINVIAIPRCTNGTDKIGFYSTTCEMEFYNEVYDTEDIDEDTPFEKETYLKFNFLIKLCPSIKRDIPDTLIKIDPNAADPILDTNDDRVCMDFTPTYNSNGYDYVRSNISYDETVNSFYCNTMTSATENIVDDLLNTDYNRVPCYKSHLQVYSIPQEFSADANVNFEFDIDNIKSCIYNCYTDEKCDVYYSASNPIVSAIPMTVVTSGDDEYSATVVYYDIEQYVYKNELGSYKNQLLFEIRQKYDNED